MASLEATTVLIGSVKAKKQVDPLVLGYCSGALVVYGRNYCAQSHVECSVSICSCRNNNPPKATEPTRQSLISQLHDSNSVKLTNAISSVWLQRRLFIPIYPTLLFDPYFGNPL